MYSSHFLIENPLLSPLGGIKAAGSVVGGEGVLTSSRVLNSYSLVLIFGGEGLYRDKSGASFDLQRGDIILLDPKVEHWYGPKKGKSWNEIFIIFEGPVFDLWFQKHYVDLRRKRLHLTPLPYWIERFVYACGSQHNDDPYEQMKDVLRIQELLSEIYRATQEQENPSPHQWANLAKKALEELKDPHFAAAELAMPYETFRKKFKKCLGIAPQHYLIHMTLKTAQKMLNSSDKPIYRIALDLGYCDEFYFSKQFTKYIGCSPSEYRNSDLSS